MKVEGVLFYLLPGMPPRQAGQYILTYGSRATERPSPIECPYCHLPLTIADTEKPVYRIVAHVGEREVIGQPMPATHQLLGCNECGNTFTTLRKGV